MPNDSKFGDVDESALKVQEIIYTDNDYINRLEKSDFVSVDNLVKAVTNLKVDVGKNKGSWLNCYEIQLIKEQTTNLLMKSDLS